MWVANEAELNERAAKVATRPDRRHRAWEGSGVPLYTYPLIMTWRYSLFSPWTLNSHQRRVSRVDW